MLKVNVLKRHVKALDTELGRRFPRVEKVGPLVVKAISVVEQKTMLSMLISQAVPSIGGHSKRTTKVSIKGCC